MSPHFFFYLALLSREGFVLYHFIILPPGRVVEGLFFCVFKIIYGWLIPTIYQLAQAEFDSTWGAFL